MRASGGNRYYAKLGDVTESDQYTGEAESLKAIHAAAPGLAPRVFTYGVVDGHSNEAGGRPYFLSEYKDMGSLLVKSAELLGERMATELHTYKSKKGYGFDVPTYCGATRQENGWFETWEECYSSMIENLLLKLKGRSGSVELIVKGEQVRSRVIPWLLRPLRIEPVLLHGDLWNGNMGVDRVSGQPVIFDPSSYFGHHEADLDYMHVCHGGQDVLNRNSGPSRSKFTIHQRQRVFITYPQLSNHCPTFIVLSQPFLTEAGNLVDHWQGPLNLNKPVPAVKGFFPLNEPDVGSAYTNMDVFTQNKDLPVLFQPLTIKDVTFKNRVWLSPMCQYSSDGYATDWHLVHLGGFASRGVGAIIVEATAVLPEGRISPEDLGIWADSHIEPLQRIVNFAHTQGTVIGIQLAHAGRKASTYAPWVHSNAAGTHRTTTYVAGLQENGWPEDVYGPTSMPFSDSYPLPRPMSDSDIISVENAFVAAVDRCRKARFDFIEVHAAHGYLLHEFLSPLSNTRTDAYGGCLSNRMRLPLQLVKRVRKAWTGKPLFVRISATDWAEGPEKSDDGEWKQWGIEQSKVFVGELKNVGVDLIDTSSGGNWVRQKIPLKQGYQVPFAAELKAAYPDILIGAVGLLTDPSKTESYLKEGKSDVVLLARELLRNPHWVLTAARALGVAAKPAVQYERAWADMLAPAGRI